MATALINYSTAIRNFSTSITCNKPTSTAEGDLMFARSASNNSSTTISWSNSLPSGWTSIAQGNYSELFYKVAGSSEPSSYSWGYSSSGTSSIIITTYRGGFNISNPIDVVSNTNYVVNDYICRAVSMSVTSTGSFILFFPESIHSGGQTFTNPITPTTGWVLDADYYWSSYGITQRVYSLLWTGSGSTGDIDTTLGYSGTGKHAFAVSLNPLVSVNTTNFFNFI